jgi:hypothetical protein
MLAQKHGLLSIHNAGGAWVSEAGKRVQFTYTLSRPEARQPQALVHHIVELEGPTNSFVQASYSIDEGRKTVYYSGPAADTERLSEELANHADEIFAEAVQCLRTKLSSSFS